MVEQYLSGKSNVMKKILSPQKYKEVFIEKKVECLIEHSLNMINEEGGIVTIGSTFKDMYQCNPSVGDMKELKKRFEENGWIVDVAKNTFKYTITIRPKS